MSYLPRQLTADRLGARERRACRARRRRARAASWATIGPL